MFIEITDRNAIWIAKRLRDFADWPGITHTKACKLRGMACNLEKKVEESKKFAQEHPEVSDCPYCGRKANV